jgi:hypothetical protein
LADHPHLLVIEDDHFPLLARAGYHTVIGVGHDIPPQRPR